MNSQQAINLLKGLEQSLDDYCELNDEGKAAFRMAITALELFGNSEQLPYAQPEKRTEERTETHGVCLDAWKADFKGFVDSLDMPRDDYKGIMEYIDEVPSAQPEIVRCKDCKYIEAHHYEENGEPPYIKYTCAYKAGLAKGYQVHECDFCSRAERRTDGVDC